MADLITEGETDLVDVEYFSLDRPVEDAARHSKTADKIQFAAGTGHRPPSNCVEGG